MDRIDYFLKYNEDKKCLCLSYNGKEIKLTDDEQVMSFMALCKKFVFENIGIMEDYFKKNDTVHAEVFYPCPEYTGTFNDVAYKVYLGYTIEKIKKS